MVRWAFLRYVAAIKPDVGFADLANDAAPNQLDSATQAITGATLVPHLGHDFVLERGLTHDSRFMHRAGEGLFTIDMFAALHGRYGGHGVSVVGRGDHHGIDLLVHLVQHPPEISERPGLRMLLEDVARPFLVHITQSDEVHARAGNVVEVTSSLAADTDAADIPLAAGVVGERESGSGQEEQSRAAEGPSSKEAAARKQGLHAVILVAGGVGGRGNQSAGGTLPGVYDVGGGGKANGEPHLDPECLRNKRSDLGARSELLAGNHVGQSA